MKEICNGTYEIHIHEQTVVISENEIAPENDVETSTPNLIPTKAIPKNKTKDVQTNDDSGANKDDQDKPKLMLMKQNLILMKNNLMLMKQNLMLMKQKLMLMEQNLILMQQKKTLMKMKHQKKNRLFLLKRV